MSESAHSRLPKARRVEPFGIPSDILVPPPDESSERKAERLALCDLATSLRQLPGGNLTKLENFIDDVLVLALQYDIRVAKIALYRQLAFFLKPEERPKDVDRAVWEDHVKGLIARLGIPDETREELAALFKKNPQCTVRQAVEYVNNHTPPIINFGVTQRHGELH